MGIRIPGLPPELEAVRICNGQLVGDNEFEIHGKTIRKGGRGHVSAVVVKPRDGFEFVPHTNGHYKVQKKEPAAAPQKEEEPA